MRTLHEREIIDLILDYTDDKTGIIDAEDFARRVLADAHANKPYLLFAGFDALSGGGWEDFKGSFSSQDEAAFACVKEEPSWAHIVYDDRIVSFYDNIHGWRC